LGLTFFLRKTNDKSSASTGVGDFGRFLTSRMPLMALRARSFPFIACLSVNDDVNFMVVSLSSVIAGQDCEGATRR